MTDAVDHPGHYTEVVPGLECIQVTQWFNFNRGNAIKYLWRAGAKGDAVEDLRKAAKYIEFEIARLEQERVAMRDKLLADLPPLPEPARPNVPTTSGPLPEGMGKLFKFPPPPVRWSE